jgi:hypothetical protein
MDNFESFPFDVRDVLLLLTSFFIDVGEELFEFLPFVFVARITGDNFGLTRLIWETNERSLDDCNCNEE